jgi:hypothetical protein
MTPIGWGWRLLVYRGKFQYSMAIFFFRGSDLQYLPQEDALKLRGHA